MDNKDFSSNSDKKYGEVLDELTQNFKTLSNTLATNIKVASESAKRESAYPKEISEMVKYQKMLYDSYKAGSLKTSDGGKLSDSEAGKAIEALMKRIDDKKTGDWTAMMRMLKNDPEKHPLSAQESVALSRQLEDLGDIFKTYQGEIVTTLNHQLGYFQKSLLDTEQSKESLGKVYEQIKDMVDNSEKFNGDLKTQVDELLSNGKIDIENSMKIEQILNDVKKNTSDDEIQYNSFKQQSKIVGNLGEMKSDGKNLAKIILDGNKKQSEGLDKLAKGIASTLMSVPTSLLGTLMGQTGLAPIMGSVVGWMGSAGSALMTGMMMKMFTGESKLAKVISFAVAPHEAMNAMMMNKIFGDKGTVEVGGVKLTKEELFHEQKKARASKIYGENASKGIINGDDANWAQAEKELAHESKPWNKMKGFAKTASERMGGHFNTGMEYLNTKAPNMMKYGKGILEAGNSKLPGLAEGFTKALPKIAGVGKFLGEKAPLIAGLVTAAEQIPDVQKGFKKGKFSGAKSLTLSGGKVAGTMAGMWAGGEAGGAIGGLLGSFAGPLGTAIGAGLGGIIGGTLGAIFGEKFGSMMMRKIALPLMDWMKTFIYDPFISPMVRVITPLTDWLSHLANPNAGKTPEQIKSEHEKLQKEADFRDKNFVANDYTKGVQKVKQVLFGDKDKRFSTQAKETWNKLTGKNVNMPTQGTEGDRFSGSRLNPFDGQVKPHTGIDIAAKKGTSVNATLGGGTVEFAGEMPGYGNTVITRSPDGRLTKSAHLDKILVKKGQKVKAGQQLGTVGSTGNSTGPHLHYETSKKGVSLAEFQKKSSQGYKDGAYDDPDKVLADYNKQQTLLAQKQNKTKLTPDPMIASTLNKKTPQLKPVEGATKTSVLKQNNQIASKPASFDKASQMRRDTAYIVNTGGKVYNG